MCRWSLPRWIRKSGFEIRGALVKAKVVPTPFYKKPKKVVTA